MSLTNIFGIVGSALTAQSVRLNTTASNLANVDSISSSYGATYRARYPVFQAVKLNNDFSQSSAGQVGVRVAGIVQSSVQPTMRHDPANPLADDNGNVYVANINTIEEMTNMIEASRSYQTNIQVATTARQLIQQTLRMGQ